MTITKFQPNSFAYTKHRVDFYGAVVEQWKADHDEANLCCELEQLLRDVVVLLGDIFALDSRVQASYFAGKPYDAAFAEVVGDLLARWVKLADRCEQLARDMERRGHEVEGVAAFRTAFEEGRAASDPSDTLPAGLTASRDAAVAELSAGGTDTWE